MDSTKRNPRYLCRFVALGLAYLQANGQSLSVPAVPPAGTSKPVGEAFVSLSFEFGSFPTYAGNKSAPNQLTGNLLDNIARYQGTRPYVRVGGVTQDMALLNGYVTTPFNYTQLQSPTRDPSVIEYGSAFFDSYQALATGGTKFIHGLNLAKSDGNFRRNFYGGAVVACSALQKTNSFLAWELGNEPDLYAVPSPPIKVNIGGIKIGGLGAVRTVGGWNEKVFANEWKNITTELKGQISYVCPQLVTSQAYRFMAPGFSGMGETGWDSWTAYTGLNRNVVREISSHSAMASPDHPFLTAASTLLNTTHTYLASQPVLALAKKLATSPNAPNLVVTQSTSITPQGLGGLSNTFASALWTLDYNLLMAASNVSRVHTHTGIDFPAALWQPVRTGYSGIEIKPGYYGMIASAAMVGNVASRSKSQVQIAKLPLGSDTDSAYVAYENGALQRVMVINLRSWNASLPGQEQAPPASELPVVSSTVSAAPKASGHHHGALQRLLRRGDPNDGSAATATVDGSATASPVHHHHGEKLHLIKREDLDAASIVTMTSYDRRAETTSATHHHGGRLRLKKREDSDAAPPDTATPAASSSAAAKISQGSSEGKPHRGGQSHRPAQATPPSVRFRRSFNTDSTNPSNTRSTSSSAAGGRRSTTYTIKLPSSCASKSLVVSRMTASGSDATEDITWDGYSYPASAQGKPIKQGANANTQESLNVSADGNVTLTVNYSEAAMISLNC